MRRIAAIVALATALALGACGSDNEGSKGSSNTTTQAPATTQKTTTTTVTAPTTTGTPTAPESATTPSSGAPDSGISTRPGGPSDSGY
jgi:ABC-type glycerol-3-phosphate transport system substrate-binding protein